MHHYTFKSGDSLLFSVYLIRGQSLPPSSQQQQQSVKRLYLYSHDDVLVAIYNHLVSTFAQLQRNIGGGSSLSGRPIWCFASLFYYVQAQSNFVGGTVLDIWSTRMAFLVRDCQKFYGTDTRQMAMYSLICERLYTRLCTLQRRRQDDGEPPLFVIRDFCNVLFEIYVKNYHAFPMAVQQLRAAVETLPNSVQVPDLWTSFDLLIDHRVALPKEGEAKLHEYLEHLLNDEPTARKLLNRLSMLLIIFAPNFENNANLIVNKFYEHHMQQSLSSKKKPQPSNNGTSVNFAASSASTAAHPSTTTNTTTTTNDNMPINAVDDDDDEEEDDDGHDNDDVDDDDEDESNVEDDMRELVALAHVGTAAGSVEVINDVVAQTTTTTEDGASRGGPDNRNRLFFAKFLYDDCALDASLANINARECFLSIAGMTTFRTVRLYVQYKLVKQLVERNLCFAYEIKKFVNNLYGMLTVEIHVFMHTMLPFVQNVKRYINKNAHVYTADSKFGSILAISPIRNLDLDFFAAKRRISFVASNAKLDLVDNETCRVIEPTNVIYSRVANHMFTFEPRKCWEYTDTYIVVEKHLLRQILARFTCFFRYRYKVCFRQWTFIYVHLYMSRAQLNSEFFKFLAESASVVSKSSAVDSLDILWSNRPRCQLLYTSIYELLDRDDPKYLRNILTHHFISQNRYSPVPRTADDQRRYEYTWMRVAKSVQLNAPNLFSIKNVVDGPLNNMVSIKSITSLADQSVDNNRYRVCSTAASTLLNCPIARDTQAVDDAVLL